MGHSSDDETGLLYMRARYYDPVLGRFVSEDPGRNWNNWFLYASADAVNRVDANGKMDWSIAGTGIGTAIWSGLLTGFFNALVGWFQGGSFIKDFLAGFVGGFIAALGLGGAIAGAFVTTALTQLSHGVGLYASLKRGLVSAGIGGAGVALVLKLGDIKNAEYIWALVAFDADTGFDAAVGAIEAFS